MYLFIITYIKYIIYFIIYLYLFYIYVKTSSYTPQIYTIFNCQLYLNNGEGNGNPLQHSCLENPMDGGAWWAAGHEVAKSRTQLSDFTFPFHFHALEKEMATHSSVLAWRIPGMEEPGGLTSMWLHRVGHDWSDLAVAAAAYLNKLGKNFFFQRIIIFFKLPKFKADSGKMSVPHHPIFPNSWP